ncbi:Vacuolar protein-sorting-associated protein 25 [Eumeta japonica]|uniref:Inositol-pentakisphosphate 2-kinase n=1 Tax=Eumeta variegata TaxID=151549 RepID=A0A4C1TDX8_EUMVA|nr:Vacuolar protein-sorting-associated protein 25 [Eumeta japonica]
MDFVDIENIRWKYINEGNLHIVIEIVGTDLVLRLIKKDDQSLDLEYIDNAVNFVNIIVLPLLRQDENLKVKIVRIRENTAAKLMKELSVYRPKDRLIKSNISSYAVMAPNLAKWSDNCEDISDINDYEYIPLVLDLISSKKLNLYEHKDREVFLSICPPLYLAVISSIVKDCSIMISFSETNDDVTGCHVAVINNYKMYYKVGVTDLEPKPLSTLLKRDNYEKKLLEVYNNMCPKHTNSEMSVRVAQNWFKHLQSSDFDVKDEPHSGRHVTDKDDPILEKVEIQPHTETKAKQLDAWQQLIVDYLKATKQSAIDIREIQSTPLFNNTSINRKLSQESILIILEDMAKKGKAAPVDKSKMVWEIYWHSLDEWGNMLYSWACNNGMNNAVCTIFELREGDNTVDEVSESGPLSFSFIISIPCPLDILFPLKRLAMRS